MDTKKVLEFLERYQSMGEDELVVIHEKQSLLVEEAKMALATVISERNIDLQELIKDEIKEKEQRIKKQELIAIKKQKRDAFIYKIMLVVGLPLCLFQFLFNPDRFFQTLFATIGSALGIAIILGVLYMFKKVFNAK